MIKLAVFFKFNFFFDLHPPVYILFFPAQEDLDSCCVFCLVAVVSSACLIFPSILPLLPISFKTTYSVCLYFFTVSG